MIEVNRWGIYGNKEKNILKYLNEWFIKWTEISVKTNFRFRKGTCWNAWRIKLIDTLLRFKINILLGHEASGWRLIDMFLSCIQQGIYFSGNLINFVYLLWVTTLRLCRFIYHDKIGIKFTITVFYRSWI